MSLYDDSDIRDRVYDLLEYSHRFFVGQGDVQAICSVLDELVGSDDDENVAVLAGAYLARWYEFDIDIDEAREIAGETLEIIC